MSANRARATGIPENGHEMECVARAFGFQSLRHMQEVTTAAEAKRKARRKARISPAVEAAMAEHDEYRRLAIEQGQKDARERESRRVKKNRKLSESARARHARRREAAAAS